MWWWLRTPCKHTHSHMYTQAEMQLEHMMGMQPALYHRYNVEENEDEEEEDDDHDFKPSSYGAQAITDAISNIDLNDTNPWHDPQGQEDDGARDVEEEEAAGVLCVCVCGVGGAHMHVCARGGGVSIACWRAKLLLMWQQ